MDKEIKNYKVIVERIEFRDTSDFLNDITVHGYNPLSTKTEELCFNSVNKAVKAIKTHAENWVGKQDANDFGYDIVPVYKNEDWGKPVKIFEMIYSLIPLQGGGFHEIKK